MFFNRILVLTAMYSASFTIGFECDSDFDEDIFPDDENNLRKHHNGNYFDALIFTQTWQPSYCVHWRQSSRRHICRKMETNQQWTIHGVWPTKWGTTTPSFCDDNNRFDINNLHNLMDQMKRQWPTIARDDNGHSFWAHEWKRHGTCAAQLPQLSTQNQYFSQGLRWNSRYNLGRILTSGGIMQSKKYPLSEIWNVLTQALGADPQLKCFKDRSKNVEYLEEISICFDKKLSIINCKPIIGKMNRKTNTLNQKIEANSNCDSYSMIEYPSPDIVNG